MSAIEICDNHSLLTGWAFMFNAVPSRARVLHRLVLQPIRQLLPFFLREFCGVVKNTVDFDAAWPHLHGEVSDFAIRLTPTSREDDVIAVKRTQRYE
jgi:hypothetical protein